MNYDYTRKLNISFARALDKVRQELSKEGFGVLSEINVKDTLKRKLDIDYENYFILGACNPSLAYQALKIEKKIGLFLPCNIVVYEDGDGVFASAILPTAAMSIVDNPPLKEIAKEAEGRLKKVIDNLVS